MKNQFKKENAITLIALVITIIVLLILAGVTITTLTGDNGLLQKTTDAKIASEEAKLQDEVQLALIENEANKYTNPETENSLKKIFEKIYGEGNIESITKSGKNYKVVVKNSSIRYKISSDGKVTKYEEMQPTSMYSKLDTDGTLYLKATEDENNGYKTYTGSASIQINWSDKTPSSVTKVVIEEPIAPSDMTSMFQDFTNLEEIQNINNLHTENVRSMNCMFTNCKKLTSLNLSQFDTSNVLNMNSMFNGCITLTSLDVSSFDTSNVTDMSQMFKGCGIESLDLSTFDTRSVNTMSYMFNACINLTNLNISNFYTPNLTNTSNMFSWRSTTYINVDMRNMDLSKVTNMSDMITGKRIKIKAKQDTKDILMHNFTDLTEENF